MALLLLIRTVTTVISFERSDFYIIFILSYVVKIILHILFNLQLSTLFTCEIKLQIATQEIPFILLCLVALEIYCIFFQ